MRGRSKSTSLGPRTERRKKKQGRSKSTSPVKPLAWYPAVEWLDGSPEGIGLPNLTGLPA